MISWDFRYIESRRYENKTLGYNRNHVDSAGRYPQLRPRSAKVNPWLCLLVIAFCALGLVALWEGWL